jgi:hypothetical protein
VTEVKTKWVMKQSWIRKILGGISLTSALFVFQTCYGTPQDAGLDLLIEGQVTSKLSGLPVEGIKVSVAENSQHRFTDPEGKFSFYTGMLENLTLLFEDVYSVQNGSFKSRDTVLTKYQDKIYLDIELEEK